MKINFLFFVFLLGLAVSPLHTAVYDDPSQELKFNPALNDLLFKAINKKDLELVKVLLHKKANPNAVRETGITALMDAVQCGYTKYLGSTKLLHASIVRILLKAGADVNGRDDHNQTALMHACICGHATIVKILLEACADPDLKDHEGMTARDYAQGKPKVKKMFVKFDRLHLKHCKKLP